MHQKKTTESEKILQAIQLSITLCIVSILQACSSDSSSSSPYFCKGAPLRDVNEIRDQRFLYNFTLNGVPFKISSADLYEFDVQQRGSIMECDNPELSSLRVKLPNGFAGSIIDSKSFGIIEGRATNLRNYYIPAAEHIEAERDRLFSDRNRLVIPLEFRSSRLYYCRACKPFFDFPVWLNIHTPLGDKYEPAVYNSVTGEFSGFWAVNHQSMIVMPNGPYKNLLQYSLTLYPNNVEFTDLPKVYVEVERKLKSWME